VNPTDQRAPPTVGPPPGLGGPTTFALASVQQPLSAKQRRFLRLYVASLVISFSPSKAAGAMVAWFFLAAMVLYVRHRSATHLSKYCLFLGLYTGVGILYWISYEGFSFGNYYLFLITASSALILLYDLREFATPPVLLKMTASTSVILIVEAGYGILQGVVGFLVRGTLDGATGDFVRGTIELNLLSHAGTGSNQMYAILMSTLLLFVVAATPGRGVRRKRQPTAIAWLAWLQASVMHSIVYLAAATSMAGLGDTFLRVRNKLLGGQRGRWKTRLKLFGALAVTAGVVMLALPQNLATLPRHVRDTFLISESGVSEKAVATYNTIFRLSRDEPVQPFVGLGLGQYSSRAALIRSGEYLSARVPIPVYANEYTQAYILSLWESFSERHPGGGSTYFPFYSWLSVYGELGILGVVAVTVLLAMTAWRILRRRSAVFRYLSLVTLILLIYVAMLGLQDNYWEWTQAIFPAFLILRLAIQYLEREQQAYARWCRAVR